jgi:hypothetical protein
LNGCGSVEADTSRPAIDPIAWALASFKSSSVCRESQVVNKVYASAAEALSDISDGASIDVDLEQVQSATGPTLIIAEDYKQA